MDIEESLREMYAVFAIGGMLISVLAFFEYSTRRSGKKIDERTFRNQYRTALGEAAQSFVAPSPGDLGLLVRLYWDNVQDGWRDGRGKQRQAECVGIEPLNIYYGLGDYERSDVIAKIYGHAMKYRADAYALSPGTLYVHRDTVLAVSLFRLAKENQDDALSRRPLSSASTPSLPRPTRSSTSLA